MGLAHEVFENPKEERTRQFLSKIMNNLKAKKELKFNIQVLEEI